jgi:hypothetical protein
MQNGNERPGANFGLPSSYSYSSPTQWLAGFIITALLALGFYRLALSQRYRGETGGQAQRPAHGNPIRRFNTPESLLRAAGNKNPENLDSSVLREDTNVNLSETRLVDEQNIQVSDLIPERIIDPNQAISSQNSGENETSHSELTILDDSIIQETKNLSLSDEVKKTGGSSTKQAISISVSKSKRKSTSTRKREKRPELNRVSWDNFMTLLGEGQVTIMRAIGPGGVTKHVVKI